MPERDVWEVAVPGPADLTLHPRIRTQDMSEDFLRRLTEFVVTVRALDRVPILTLVDGRLTVASIPEQL